MDSASRPKSGSGLHFFEAVNHFLLFEHYHVVREVGRGSAGKAVLMRHPITQHSVVGKVVPLKDLQEAWMLRQLEQEVTILSRLNHDNVIRYIATFQAPQRVTRATMAVPPPALPAA